MHRLWPDDGSVVGSLSVCHPFLFTIFCCLQYSNVFQNLCTTGLYDACRSPCQCTPCTGGTFITLSFYCNNQIPWTVLRLTAAKFKILNLTEHFRLCLQSIWNRVFFPPNTNSKFLYFNISSLILVSFVKLRLFGYYIYFHSRDFLWLCLLPA
jgi:hypothetical protein